MKTGVLLVLFLCFVSIVKAQQPAHFFLGKDEFEGVQIYDVIQDNHQNYWFASDQGFYKYDGYQFSKISAPGLKGQSAFGFVKNKNGIIYCYNLNHQILQIKNGKCSVIYELKENERSSDIFLEITETNLLLILAKKALLLNESGVIQNRTNEIEFYYGFPFKIGNGKHIGHLLQHDSLLIVAGNKFSLKPIRKTSESLSNLLKFFRINSKIYAIDILTKKMYRFHESNFELELMEKKGIFPETEFLRFYNENNQLWVAGTISGVRVISNPESLEMSGVFFPEYVISDVFKDAEGNMLLSTFNHGVIVIPNLEIPDVLPVSGQHNVVSTLYDPSRGMLLGTEKGKLVLYDGKKYKILSESGSRPLQVVYTGKDFPYIIFDDGQIKMYHKKTGKVDVLVKASLKDVDKLDENSFYVALNLGVAKVMVSRNKQIHFQYIASLRLRSYAIALDAEKRLFVATSDGLKTLLKNGSSQTIRYRGEVVFANDITANGQYVFVATKNHGVLQLKGSKVIRQIKPLINQQKVEVYKIKALNNSLFANTSEGFLVMNFKGKISLHLNKMHGFQSNKIYDFDIVNNKIWIAHSKGVQLFNFNELKTASTKPLMRISAIKVNNKELENTAGKGIFESAAQKFLFTLSSPTLRNKESIQYHYQLLGYDSDWQLAAYVENDIVYNALQPGTYTFRVKSENKGVFSPIVSYSFSIAKPIYLRWWFLVLSGIALATILYFFYRRQIEKISQRKELLNEVNLSKLAAIQSQMNPHFIFNALNSIQDLVLKGDIDNSYSSISVFSDLIRRTLNYSDKDFIDFEQEIKLIELYLSLENLRFKSDLSYQINTNGIDDIQIPPMLIQPFIENALVHGLMHKEGQKKLSISFELNKHLICLIEDNGIGRHRSREIKERQRGRHESFSVKAISKRFEILSKVYEGEYKFTYEDLFEEGKAIGTRVRLDIPFKRKF